MKGLWDLWLRPVYYFLLLCWCLLQLLLFMLWFCSSTKLFCITLLFCHHKKCVYLVIFISKLIFIITMWLVMQQGFEMLTVLSPAGWCWSFNGLYLLVSSRDCKQTSNRNTQAFFFAAQILYLGNDIINYVKHYLRTMIVHLFFSLPWLSYSNLHSKR